MAGGKEVTGARVGVYGPQFKEPRAPGKRWGAHDLVQADIAAGVMAEAVVAMAGDVEFSGACG